MDLSVGDVVKLGKRVLLAANDDLWDALVSWVFIMRIALVVGGEKFGLKMTMMTLGG